MKQVLDPLISLQLRQPKQSRLVQRELCFRCLNAQSTCYCSDLRPFRLGFQLVLLQHPRERKRTVGTARMVHLSVANSKLIEGKGFEDSGAVTELLEDPQNYCVVLYPGKNSIPLAPEKDAEPTWLPKGKKLVLFVIDGTWGSARQMIAASPRLMTLPQVCFQADRRSEYGFRRQPQPHCLSTVEAVHQLVGILEPSVNAESLLDLFRKMVRRQLAYSTPLELSREQNQGTPTLRGKTRGI